MFSKRCLASAASSLAVLSPLASTCSQTPSSRARNYEPCATASDLEQRIQGFLHIRRALFWRSVSEIHSKAGSMCRTLPHQADAKSFGNPQCKTTLESPSARHRRKLESGDTARMYGSLQNEAAWSSECSTTSPYSPAANKSAPQHMPATLPTRHEYP